MGTIIEEELGGFLLGNGVNSVLSIFGYGIEGKKANTLIRLLGGFLIIDANGLTTDYTNINKIYNSGLSIMLSLTPAYIIEKIWFEPFCTFEK